MSDEISDSNSPLSEDPTPMSHQDESYHEGSELLGMTTMLTIILGLIGVGLVMFALAWALAT